MFVLSDIPKTGKSVPEFPSSARETEVDHPFLLQTPTDAGPPDQDPVGEVHRQTPRHDSRP